MVFETTMTIQVVFTILGLGYTAIAIFNKSKLIAVIAVAAEFIAYML